MGIFLRLPHASIHLELQVQALYIFLYNTRVSIVASMVEAIVEITRISEMHNPIVEASPSLRAQDDNTRDLPSQPDLFIPFEPPPFHFNQSDSTQSASTVVSFVAASLRKRKRVPTQAENRHKPYIAKMGNGGNGILYRWEVSGVFFVAGCSSQLIFYCLGQQPWPW